MIIFCGIWNICRRTPQAGCPVLRVSYADSSGHDLVAHVLDGVDILRMFLRLGLFDLLGSLQKDPEEESLIAVETEVTYAVRLLNGRPLVLI